MSFPGLDPMVLESAWGGDSVQRNQTLLPGRQTNTAFVYNTPLIHFPNKIRPSLTYAEETDLKQWGGANPTLEDCLGGFFKYLLAAQATSAPNSIRLIKVTTSAALVIQGGATPVYSRIPLTYTPSFAFNVTTDDDPSQADPFIKQLADAAATQAANSGVKATAARRYYFDITAFAQGADVATPGAPLSRMSNLFYDAAGT
jgi:hypothetical protein